MAGLSNSYPVYATAEDLNAYLGSAGPDTDAETHLADASGAIRSWTVTAHYATENDDWTPSDERIHDAFHDATILQAAALFKAKITAADSAAVANPTIISKSLGGRSVTYAQDGNAASARAALLNGSLAPQAVAVLAGAGLLSSTVITGRVADYDVLARSWIIDGGNAFA